MNSEQIAATSRMIALIALTFSAAEEGPIKTEAALQALETSISTDNQNALQSAAGVVQDVTETADLTRC